MLRCKIVYLKKNLVSSLYKNIIIVTKNQRNFPKNEEQLIQITTKFGQTTFDKKFNKNQNKNRGKKKKATNQNPILLIFLPPFFIIISLQN